MLRIIQANKNASSGTAIEYGAFKIRDRAIGHVTGSRAPGCGSCTYFDTPSYLRC